MFGKEKAKKEISPKNLKQVNERLIKLERELEKLNQELNKDREANVSCVQRLGLVRYNALQKIGGEQSFSLAMLNKKDSGIVITSLHFKDTYKIFAKPIKQGKSNYPLSTEEIGAINKAKILEKHDK